MSIQDNFRLAMRRYIYSVSIMSNKDDNRNLNAITVSSVTSISMDPPSLLICINKSSRIHNTLQIGSKFCINLLNKQQIELSMNLLENLSAYDYSQLFQEHLNLKSTLGENGVVLSEENEGERHTFQTWFQVLDFMVSFGKKGMYIQRYKGLGEMNPEQLWETTLDPKIRTLKKVKVEDIVESDGIFTILMGDHVEPRRKFIEENALRVKNLDV